jgi:hypothetical protein
MMKQKNKHTDQDEQDEMGSVDRMESKPLDKET